jgi:hypothetical protein
VHRRCGSDAPSPRTIQRIRARHGLVRCFKRAHPMKPRRRLTPEARERVAAIITEKPHNYAIVYRPDASDQLRTQRGHKVIPALL